MEKEVDYRMFQIGRRSVFWPSKIVGLGSGDLAKRYQDQLEKRVKDALARAGSHLPMAKLELASFLNARQAVKAAKENGVTLDSFRLRLNDVRLELDAARSLSKGLWTFFDENEEAFGHIESFINPPTAEAMQAKEEEKIAEAV